VVYEVRGVHAGRPVVTELLSRQVMAPLDLPAVQLGNDRPGPSTGVEWPVSMSTSAAGATVEHRGEAGSRGTTTCRTAACTAHAPVGLLRMPTQSKGAKRARRSGCCVYLRRAKAARGWVRHGLRRSGPGPWPRWTRRPRGPARPASPPGRPGTVYTEMSSGARSGGQTTARSFASPRDPVPVLSPTRHPDGRPARIRASPVVAPRSPAGRWSSAPVGPTTRVGSAAVAGWRRRRAP
jgi:hypothetical protein